MAEKNELYEKITEHILNSSKDGQIETEYILAKRFNVSRYRVRKVLDSLVQMGMLERSPRRGSILKTPDKNILNEQMKLQLSSSGFDAAEFVEARILVECSIIPLAVRRITPSMISKLEEILKNMEANIEDSVFFEEQNTNFHVFLSQTCGNGVLQILSDMLINLCNKEIKPLNNADVDFCKAILKKKKEILSLIKKGDADKAALQMKEHLKDIYI